MSLPTRISEPATTELEAAIAWYEERRPGLGADLFDAVIATLTRIESNPASGPVTAADGSARRLLVSGFPYAVIYVAKSTEIVVVAIAHLKRRPGYWRGRTGV